jgi:hypothetical protein
VLRFLLWRMLGLAAAIGGAGLAAWFLGGGPGRLLRGHADGNTAQHVHVSVAGAIAPLRLLLALAVATALLIALTRAHSRHRRRYVRLLVEPYRGDHADAHALLRMFDTVMFLDPPGDRPGNDEDTELAGVGVGDADGGLVF